MNSISTRLLTALILSAPISLTAAGPAHADPAPSDYSQINGQLVPVWNISTNPVGLMVGSYGISGSYGFHRNLALRLDANYYNDINGDDEGFEVGAGMPIYLRKTYQGPFVEPGVMLRRATGTGDGPGPATTVTTVGPQVLLGWQWMWDSGFNLAIAAGVGRNWSAGRSDGSDKVFANGYIRVGYAF